MKPLSYPVYLALNNCPKHLATVSLPTAPIHTPNSVDVVVLLLP